MKKIAALAAVAAVVLSGCTAGGGDGNTKSTVINKGGTSRMTFQVSCV